MKKIVCLLVMLLIGARAAVGDNVYFFADFEGSADMSANKSNLDAGTSTGSWTVDERKTSSIAKKSSRKVAAFEKGSYTNTAELASTADFSDEITLRFDVRAKADHTGLAQNKIMLLAPGGAAILQLQYNTTSSGATLWAYYGSQWNSLLTSPLMASPTLDGGVMDSIKVVLKKSSFNLYANDNQLVFSQAYQNQSAADNGLGKIKFIGLHDASSVWYDNIRVSDSPWWISPLFQSNMVLQRGANVPFWGRTTPNQAVTVKVDGTIEGSTVADGYGFWMATINKHSAGNGQSHTVTISSGTTKTVTLTNVVFGDVFLASGQSNMWWPLGSSLVTNSATEVAAANYPLIRQVAIELEASSVEWQDPRIRLDWAECSPATAGNFSATAYFFARSVYQKTGVPVGLILSAWGGQKIERFLSPEGLERVPELSGFLYNEEQGNEAHVHDIYNAMIAPLAPYDLAGVIWYQGEANASAGDGDIYREKMLALIRGVRSNWGVDGLPFNYVQLANYNTDKDWPALRLAQLKTLAEPETGMAVTIDIGDEEHVHPGDKQDVGIRLARWALKNLGEFPNAYSGPIYKKATVEGSGIRVSFKQPGGLFVGRKNGLGAVQEITGGTLQNFEISGGSDPAKFYPATAEIRTSDNTVLVTRGSIPNPAYVRYCYTNAPSGANKLYNVLNYPASPFTSEDGPYRLAVNSGTPGSKVLAVGDTVTIHANAAPAGQAFNRWIGAASEIADPDSSTTTVTMPHNDLYLVASYRPSSASTHTLTVNDGVGGGSVAQGTIMDVEADSPPNGQVFDRWTGSGASSLVDRFLPRTTLRMPSGDLVLNATYKDK